MWAHPSKCLSGPHSSVVCSVVWCGVVWCGVGVAECTMNFNQLAL